MKAPHPDTLRLLERLIGFDTTSRNSNLELIDFVTHYLEGFSVPYRLSYDDERRKANLFATLGPDSRSGGYILSGHTDVVPVDGQDWRSDPFQLTREGSRWFGRGVADMKSFVAVVLAMVPEIVRRGPHVPIHIALSYDEEVGLVGVRGLIADMVANGIRPAGCIVGEPTSMHVVGSHKGKRSYRCHVQGKEAHSSLAPAGVNAVEYAGALIAFLRELAREFRLQGASDDEYDCPHTTVHVGLIRGGTALNIVPASCSFEFEFRHLPIDDPDQLFARIQSFVDEQLLPEMKAVDPAADIRFEPMAVIPSLDTDDDATVMQLARSITGGNKARKVSYNCEACLFHEADVPTVICGPGDIEQAHKPNEFIEVAQIAKCEDFIRALIDRTCGPAVGCTDASAS